MFRSSCGVVSAGSPGSLLVGKPRHRVKVEIHRRGVMVIVVKGRVVKIEIVEEEVDRKVVEGEVVEIT